MAKINVIREGARLPSYATTHSAGLDLAVCMEHSHVVIYPDQNLTFQTGLTLELDDDQVALIYARSGLGIKNGITLRNGTGVIDADYKGELMICLVNTSDKPFTVENGMRVAQLVITKFERFDNVKIEEKVRGEDGFGSTGT